MNLFVCYLCGYQSKHKSNLRAHMAAHAERPKSLSGWNYKSPSPPRRKSPEMTDSDGSSSCDTCEYGSPGSRGSRGSCGSRDKKKHGKKKSYECRSCDYKTSSANNLKQHKKLHGKERPEPWGFDQDPIGFLSTLIRSQTSKKIYDCSRTSKYDMGGSHKRGHTCGKSSGFLSLLKRSMTPSFGSKRHSCQECDRGSNQYSTIMRPYKPKKPLRSACDYSCNDSGTDMSYPCGYRCDSPCEKEDCDYDYSCVRTGDLKRLVVTQSADKPDRSRDYRRVTAEQYRIHKKSRAPPMPMENPYEIFGFPTGIPYNPGPAMSTLPRGPHPLEQPYAVVLVAGESVPKWRK